MIKANECIICWELCEDEVCEDEECQLQYSRIFHPEDHVVQEKPIDDLY